MKSLALLIAVMCSAIIAAACASTAAGRNLELRGTTFRAQFESLVLRTDSETLCHVTLEGSFHSRTFAKVLGSLIGYVTTARLGTCGEGRATILTVTLPWHVTYAGFAGTLPNISEFATHVIGLSLSTQNRLAVCLVTTTAGEPVSMRFLRFLESGALRDVELLGSIRTGAECLGIRATLTTFREVITQLGTTNQVSLRLI
ncbi:MAG TPA: hypothetical protein VF250_11480 [Conexibacter sp.]